MVRKSSFNKGWMTTPVYPRKVARLGMASCIPSGGLAVSNEEMGRDTGSGKRGEIEARLRRYDGVYRWFLNRIEPFLDDTGKIVRWYGTSTDIDSLKQTEQTLQMREHELVGIIEQFHQCFGQHRRPENRPTTLKDSLNMLELPSKNSSIAGG